MSDSQAYEEVTGTSDGVTVIKRFEEDEFPVPAIAFEFSSDRDEAVRVTVSDTVPESVAVEDLGFHPEYGSEYWTIDEDEITFERELDPNAEYTTVYGIRATGTDDVEKFLTVPEITDVDPPLPEDEGEVIPESDDDVVRDVISGESDEVPGLDEESDEEIETLDLKDPNDEGASAETTEAESVPEPEPEPETTEDESTADDDTSTEDTGGEVAVSGNSVVEALATEIRQNNVSAEDVKLLRQAFEIAGQEGGSIQARVERLQGDVADLRAYSDAMEEFLDENGTAEQLIEDFQSDLEALEASLDGMEATIEENSEEVSAVSEEVSSLGNDVAEIGGEVEAVSEEVEDVEDDVASVEETVSDVEETVANLEESIEQLQDNVSEEDVSERVEEIESEIDDLQTWQEQIKETFGG